MALRSPPARPAASPTKNVVSGAAGRAMRWAESRATSRMRFRSKAASTPSASANTAVHPSSALLACGASKVPPPGPDQLLPSYSASANSAGGHGSTDQTSWRSSLSRASKILRPSRAQVHARLANTGQAILFCATGFRFAERRGDGCDSDIWATQYLSRLQVRRSAACGRRIRRRALTRARATRRSTPPL